jgi:hypothetical protein
VINADHRRQSDRIAVTADNPARCHEVPQRDLPVPAYSCNGFLPVELRQCSKGRESELAPGPILAMSRHEPRGVGRSFGSFSPGCCLQQTVDDRLLQRRLDARVNRQTQSFGGDRLGIGETCEVNPADAQTGCS